MNKLLLISFLNLLSFTAYAETILRCEYFKYCEENKCSTNVTKESYEQLVYEDGWFGKKVLLDDEDYTSFAIFEDNVIKFGDPGIESSKYTFFKGIKLLRHERRFIKAQISQNERFFGRRFYKYAYTEYKCKVVN